MKYLLVVLLALISLSVFPRKLRSHSAIVSESFYKKDSLVYNSKTIYLSCPIDSLVLFLDKEDLEFHIFDSCPCIDKNMSAHYLKDLDDDDIKNHICPLCESKCKYIKVACDSIIIRSHNAD